MTTQTEPGLDAATLAAALATIANARMRAEFDAGGPLGVSKPLSPSIRADHMLALCDVAAAAVGLVAAKPAGDALPWFAWPDAGGWVCTRCGEWTEVSPLKSMEPMGHALDCPALRLDAALAALAGTGAA